jgi:hypothetical protein
MMFSNTPKKVVFFKKTTGKVNSARITALYNNYNYYYLNKKKVNKHAKLHQKLNFINIKKENLISWLQI